MNHGFIDGIRRLVGENAGGQARHDLFHTKLVAHLEDVLVHAHVVVEKVQVGIHIGKQSANLGCQVDDVCGTVLFKDGPI